MLLSRCCPIVLQIHQRIHQRNHQRIQKRIHQRIRQRIHIRIHKGFSKETQKDSQQDSQQSETTARPQRDHSGTSALQQRDNHWTTAGQPRDNSGTKTRDSEGDAEGRHDDYGRDNPGPTPARTTTGVTTPHARTKHHDFPVGTIAGQQRDNSRTTTGQQRIDREKDSQAHTRTISTVSELG